MPYKGKKYKKQPHLYDKNSLRENVGELRKISDGAPTLTPAALLQISWAGRTINTLCLKCCQA